MFKSALLCLKPVNSHDALVDFAVGHSQRYGLALTGISVVDESVVAPIEAVPVGGSVFKKERDEKFLADARAAVAEAAAKLKTACGASLAFEWVACEGKTEDEIALRAPEHDLLIVGHAGGDTDYQSLLTRILKHSPRPAIVVPPRRVIGDAIVVAYDGSLQAARTLAALAHSNFAAGQAVHVVNFDQNAQHSSQQMAIACRYLDRHGVQTTAHAEPLRGGVAKSLLDAVQQYRAGLLVMGAFGKSVAHEFLLGSVTQSVLRDLPCAVLLDH